MMLLFAALVMAAIYLQALRVETLKAECAKIAQEQPFTVRAPLFGAGDCIMIEEIYYPDEE